VRADIVEEQDLGVERDPVGLAVGGVRAGVVARADRSVVLIIAEEPFEALLDDLP
jgi:hypothetical protein